jgi:hypothetical protein
MVIWFAFSMDKRSRCSGEWAVSDGNQGDLKNFAEVLAVRKWVSAVEKGIAGGDGGI